jgi:hypothetical protein
MSTLIKSYRSLAPHLRFAYLVVAQLLLAIIALANLRLFTVEYLIVVSFLLITLTTAFTAPLAVLPQWRVRLRWVLLAWGLLFSYVAGQRIASLWV